MTVKLTQYHNDISLSDTQNTHLVFRNTLHERKCTFDNSGFMTGNC